MAVHSHRVSVGSWLSNKKLSSLSRFPSEPYSKLFALSDLNGMSIKTSIHSCNEMFVLNTRQGNRGFATEVNIRELLFRLIGYCW